MSLIKGKEIDINIDNIGSLCDDLYKAMEYGSADLCLQLKTDNNVRRISFKKGRFDNEFVPIDTFKFLEYYERDFYSYFETLIDDEVVNKKSLAVKIEKGSIDEYIKNNIPEEVISKLLLANPTETLIAIVIGVALYYASKPFNEYIQLLKLEAQNKKDTAYIDTINKALAIISEKDKLLMYKHRPFKYATEILQNDERLMVSEDIYFHSDKNRFLYEFEDEIIIEETIEITSEFELKEIGENILRLKNNTFKKFTAKANLTIETIQNLSPYLKTHNKLKIKLTAVINGNNITKAEVVSIDGFNLTKTNLF